MPKITCLPVVAIKQYARKLITVINWHTLLIKWMNFGSIAEVVQLK